MLKKKYRKRARQIVIGVQLNLDTDGFVYNKWGDEQRCESGDWLVNNGGDVYTISELSFANTYEEVALGQYIKISAVWASQAEVNGKVKTNEGYTEYRTGDYIVSNEKDGADSYAVSQEKFEIMYELLK